MPSRRSTPPWDFFLQASNPSLESFELSRLNRAANLRKEIAVLLEQWMEETAQAMLARWVREDRKALPQPEPLLDMFPQTNLPFSPPGTIGRPRQPERRLRARRTSSVA